jgi:hypothetical protein
MIPKKKEDYNFVEGAGRPYEINPRSPIDKTTEERQKPVIINLGELNGQDGNERAPKNFHPKRGRTLGTLTKLQDDDRNIEDAFDIE